MERTPRPAAAEARFRAMGSEAHVIVVGAADGVIEGARQRIADLERRWSRFRSDSELNRLNRRAGAPTRVSAETRLLVRCAVLGWRRSRGLFDPTVHDALVDAGYDRDLAMVRARPAAHTPPPRPAPGCQGVVVDDDAATVTLPPGVRLDPGGIGKGLAADLVADELMAAGAGGACVNLGGDLRVAGMSPDGEGWRVAVASPDRNGPAGALHLVSGAVATSSTLDRRWTAGGVEQHHLIAPSTGRPSPADRAVTVVAATAWEGEVAAKVAVLADATHRGGILAGLAAGALITEHGRSRGWGRISDFLAGEELRCEVTA